MESAASPPDADSVHLIVTRRLDQSDRDRMHLFWYQNIQRYSVTVKALCYRRFLLDQGEILPSGDAYQNAAYVSLMGCSIQGYPDTTFFGGDSVGLRFVREPDTNNLMFVRHQEFQIGALLHRVPVVGLFILDPDHQQPGQLLPQQGIVPTWFAGATSPYYSSPLPKDSLGIDTDLHLRNYSAYLVWTATTQGVSYVTSATRTWSTDWTVVDESKTLAGTEAADARLIIPGSDPASAPYLVWKESGETGDRLRARRIGNTYSLNSVTLTPQHFTNGERIKDIASVEFQNGFLMVAYKYENPLGVGGNIVMSNLPSNTNPTAYDPREFQAPSPDGAGSVGLLKPNGSNNALLTYSSKVDGTAAVVSVGVKSDLNLFSRATIPGAISQQIVKGSAGSASLILKGGSGDSAQLMSCKLEVTNLTPKWSTPTSLSTDKIAVSTEGKANYAAKRTSDGKVTGAVNTEAGIVYFKAE